MPSNQITNEVSSEERTFAQRASVAVALAPVLVLLALTLVVGDLIAADTGLFAVGAAIVWLVFEMAAYQRLISTDDEAIATSVAMTAPAPLAD